LHGDERTGGGVAEIQLYSAGVGLAVFIECKGKSGNAFVVVGFKQGQQIAWKSFPVWVDRAAMKR
jgi:hypothetical protein